MALSEQENKQLKKTTEMLRARLERATQIVCRHQKGCFCVSCKFYKKIAFDCRKLLGIDGRFRRK